MKNSIPSIPSLLEQVTQDQLAGELSRRRRESLIRFVSDSYRGYRSGWVHKKICKVLEHFSREVVAEKSPRLMILMPPRHGKSFIASERFPVWHLGHNPSHQVLITSYGQSLSDKFSKRARDLANSEYTEKTFTDLVLDPDKQAVQEWETTDGGAYRSVGIGGSATGTGCNILIIDDPIKNAIDANSKTKRDNDWEWYTTTAYTRLTPGGGILVIQTRWHEDDLSGRLLRAEKSGDGDKWLILTFPAIAESNDENRDAGEPLHASRYDKNKLEKIRNAIGVRAWNSLYQQHPTDSDGTILKRSWWKFFDEIPARFERLVLSWDCNFKGGISSDFVVGMLLGKIGADYYILDVERDQYDFIQTIDVVNKFSAKHPNGRPILIEDAANGPAVISTLKGRISGIVPITPVGSKEARVTTITPLIEAGNIHVRKGMPWTDAFVEEAASFPKGANDDMVDALTQAVIHLVEEGKYAVFEGIADLFGNAFIYEDGDWITDDDTHKEVFIGVKWGMGYPNQQTFYALGINGETVGYRILETNNHSIALEGLKDFAKKISRGAQITVFYEATSFGETMVRLIDADSTMDWRAVPIRMTNLEIDSMVAFLKISIADKSIRLKPWSILFDQMCSFKCYETEKGNWVYGPPDGLTANAVYALMLANEARRKYSGDLSIAVINDIEKTLTKIYYSSGDIRELE